MTKSALPMRSALETLQLECPEYRISQQVIGDQLFYVAEAAGPHVRPVFAQAQTVDRLRAKLRIPEVEINAAVPTIARIYDFLLGGKDNFEADRQQARNVLEVYPQAAELVIQARQFQARAVAYAAQQGIGQFLDLGCGLPTVPNTHQTAQAITPGARIAYVDNDAQVLTHARNLLADSTRVLACAGDLAWPAEILYDWRIRQFLDFHQPVCLVLAMTMHFFPPDQAEKITAELIGGLPPGSYVIVSVVGGDAELGQDMARTYTAASVYNHGHGGLARFLTGLDLIAPGVVPARHWRAPVFAPGHRRGQAWAAVGRNPHQPMRSPHDGQPSALEELAFEWGDAYLLSYSRDRWVALRRDTRRFLIADTLTGLEHAIQDDYRHHPVSRTCDPPGTADYLSLPEDDDAAGDGEMPDEDTRFILAALRYAFPAWTITCSPQLRAWIARTREKTICQNSPVLLCAALTLIERGQPSGSHGAVP